MLRKLLFSVLFWLGLSASAQVNSYNFDRLEVEQGLSHRVVIKIIQDSEGYIWIGTKDGLNKFNGYSFVVYNYRKNDTTSLADNEVKDIFEDSKRNIWIGTSNGLSRYDRIRNSFYNYRHTSDSSSIGGNSIESIAEDGSGGLWFGTADEGLSYLEEIPLPGEKKLNFRKVINNPSDEHSLISNHILKIYFDLHNKGWIGTQSGLCCIRNVALHTKATAFSFDAFPSLGDRQNVRDVFEDHNGNLWLLSLGTSSAGVLNVIPTEELTHESRTIVGIRAIQNIDEITGRKNTGLLSILEDKNGYIWLGTNEFGILRFVPEIKKEKLIIKNVVQFRKEANNNQSLSDNTIYALFNDHADNFWIGTNHGISVYNRYKVSFNAISSPIITEGLAETGVTSITGSNGFIFLGTGGKGVLMMNNKTERIVGLTSPSYKSVQIDSLYVNALLYDQRKNLWIGTPKGLYRLQIPNLSCKGIAEGSLLKVDKEPEYYTSAKQDSMSLYSNIIQALSEDQYGRVWIGTGMGVNVWEPRENKIKRIPKITASDDILILNENITRVIFNDKHSGTWVGTDNGLFRFDKGSNKLIQAETKLLGNNVKISCLLDDNQGNLWVGTNGNGLIHFNPSTNAAVAFTTLNGLPNDVIESIKTDNRSNLWLGTNKGLSKFALNDSTFTNYDIHSGLLSNEFFPGSGYMASDGKLFFGNSKGINAFYPDSIRQNTFIPPIAITDFKINDQSVFSGSDSTYRSRLMNNETIELSARENNLSFEVVALNFISPENNQYAFKLEGYDKDWVKNENRRFRSYTNLDPAEYTLHVKASNNNGVWNEKGISYKIIILPPIHRTWWFELLALVFLSTVSYLIYRARMRNIELWKEREVAVQTTRMKEQFLANTSHEIRTPLNAIIGMTRLLRDKNPKQEQVKYLDAISQSSDNLLVIINDILDISKIEAGKVQLEKIPFSLRKSIEGVYNTLRFKAEEKGLLLRYKVEESIPEYIIGDPVRLSQILINLVGNSIKFTEKGSVEISCHREKSEIADDKKVILQFAVSDTGIGIAEENLQKVFESFTQESSTTTRKFGGTGLGLTITKKLVEMHGGEIKLSSTLGKGTTFSFNIEYEISSESPEQQEKNSSLDEIKKSLKNISILLVEDNQFNQIVAVDTLQEEIEGVKIDVAENGKQAVEKVTHSTYDIILMDVQMPEMNGYDATKLIRQLPEPKSRTHIIAMTAGALKEEVQRCFEAGMDEYIAKPFNTEDLLLKISKMMSK